MMSNIRLLHVKLLKFGTLTCSLYMRNVPKKSILELITRHYNSAFDVIKLNPSLINDRKIPSENISDVEIKEVRFIVTSVLGSYMTLFWWEEKEMEELRESHHLALAVNL